MLFSAHFYFVGLSGLGSGPVPPVGIARTFSYGQHPPAWKATIVIGGTIPGARFSAQGCYSQHNSACGRPRRPHGLGLLFAAHFKAGCARGRISGILHAGLLFNAHFLVLDLLVFIAIPCFLIVYRWLLLSAHFYELPPLSCRIHRSRQRKSRVVIHSTILCTAYTAFSCGSQIRYPQPAQAKTTHPAKTAPHPPQKIFLPPQLLSSAHFQNPKKSFSFFLQPHPAPKIFFLRIVLSITTIPPCCYPRHNSKSSAYPLQNFSPSLGVVIQRTFCGKVPILCPKGVVIPRILLFRAQICGYSRHNALVILRTFRLLSAAQLYLISK